MTNINGIIDGIVNSMDEEDLEYLMHKARLKLAGLEPPHYEIKCSCGSSFCPTCRVFDLKAERIK